MNTENLLIVDGVEFASRSEASRHYGLDPKLVNERVTKFGWSLVQAVGAESRPSKAHSKPVEINGVKYNSVSEAAKTLGMAKTTLARKLKAGNGIDVREQLKGQSKPMFYNGNLYPSARHLLLANPKLVAGGDIDNMIALLNQKARRAKAKAKGEKLWMSLDGVSVLLGVDKLRYMNEFDAWVDTVSNQVGDAGMIEMFYCYK
ncbi:MAG: hypothetical protein ACI88H_001623 [Cocleimonas sp.]|jgi:hypothetical protein